MYLNIKAYSLAMFCVIFQAGLSLGVKAIFLTRGNSLTLNNKILIYSVSLFLMGIYAILWQYVLKKIDLSIANSIMSLVPVLIFVGGIFFFHEKININNLIGFILIISGLLIIAHSKIKQ